MYFVIIKTNKVVSNSINLTNIIADHAEYSLNLIQVRTKAYSRHGEAATFYWRFGRIFIITYNRPVPIKDREYPHRFPVSSAETIIAHLGPNEKHVSAATVADKTGTHSFSPLNEAWQNMSTGNIVRLYQEYVQYDKTVCSLLLSMNTCYCMAIY